MPIKDAFPRIIHIRLKILKYPLILRYMQAFDNLLIKSFFFSPFWLNLNQKY